MATEPSGYAAIAAKALRRQGKLRTAEVLERRARNEISAEVLELQLNCLEADDLLNKPPPPYPFPKHSSEAYLARVLGRSGAEYGTPAISAARAVFMRWHHLVREQIYEIVRLVVYFDRNDAEKADCLATLLRDLLDSYGRAQV